GDTLTSYNAAGYQWYRDGQLIPGATTAQYVPSQGGSYQVLVSDTAGCKALSNAIIITGVEDVAGSGSIAVFPNPTFNNWYIDVTADLINATAQLYDNNGRLVHQVQLVNTRTTIDFNAAQGIYLLRISNNNRTISRKLIKL
ncbi:MAG TPA: T9SS type A sorting domain-containing protein, partial [Bacteroidia bacterium]|nr:T9SS type A sorting domain-containing protein [Bacteroidia bacterium]